MTLLKRNLLKLAALLVTALSVVSCGGSGGGGGTASTTATITSISPAGMVQSTTPRAVSITGTNFASGMTVSVTDSLGVVTYTVGPVSVQSTSLISTTVTIPSAPAARYVTVAIKSSSGTTLATTIMGVATTSKILQSTAAGSAPATTDIQAIFNNSCTSCHSASAAGGLNLTSGSSAAALITTNSVGTGCSQKFRVTPGDPRRASSVLIDKIQVATTGTAACSGTGMPQSGSLTPQEISDIADWVAGGAN